MQTMISRKHVQIKIWIIRHGQYLTIFRIFYNDCNIFCAKSFSADNDFQKTVIAAQNGNTLYTTIDANIQSIVEDKIKLFSDTYANNAREGLGAENIAVVIENPKNGEILAMASVQTPAHMYV